MRRLFRWITGAFGVVALAGSPQWAAAQATADGWDLRRTPESCFLFRSFATGAGKMDVRIQSFGPTTPYHVILHGAGLPIRDNSAELGSVAFGDEDAAEQTIVFVGKAGDLPMAVFPVFFARPVNLMGVFFRGSGSPRSIAVDQAARRLFIDLPDSEPLSLELGPMAGEYARLDACAQGLVDAWSRAASGDAVPVSGPEMLDREGVNSRVWFPPNLSMNRISGMVELRMRVDDKGRARDCVAQASIGSPQFGERSCEALEQWARFEPARDAQGNPVDALFQTAIVFIIYRW